MDTDTEPPSRSRRRDHWSVLILVPSIAALSFLAFAQTTPADGGVGLGQVVLLIVLLLLSGAMSGSETALTALGEWKIHQLREEGHDPHGLFALLGRQPTRYITTLLIGNNLVNIAATALVTQISIQLSRAGAFSEAAAVAYATAVMTLLVLVVGEITPKSIAVHNPVAFARVVIRPVYALSVVLYPLGRGFTWFTSTVLRALRLESSSDPLITENELRLMLRSAEEHGVIEASEERMIKGVIDLEETVVREVMTPRVDVVSVAEDASLEQLLALVTEHGYSRLPVYRESIDDVRGIAYARDLLPYLGKPDALTNGSVADLVQPAQYVPETLSILNMMRDMRIRKNHMAIVVDEFGGTAGVVTLEDIIEEITGEIYDETDDEEEADFVDLEDGGTRVRASVHIDEVEQRFHVAFEDEGDYDTLGGFLVSEFDRIPQVGETLEHEGVRFTVEEADERRVLSVRAEVSGLVEDGAGGAAGGSGTGGNGAGEA
ncbi:MAG: HlyC/CorC family transporter [Trueperaceae bacterium]|nr:MAG: HlyC/CorC family transporter [Trueperaceae bacterium]